LKFERILRLQTASTPKTNFSHRPVTSFSSPAFRIVTSFSDGIATLMSGTPFTVFDSNDVTAQGTAPEITGFSAQRPNLNGNPNNGPRSVGTWLNASAFQRLDLTLNAGQFGTEGRNVNVGPGYADWDFAALKNLKVAESKQLQFRPELFDVLNRTNFRLPDSDISSPTFNHILAVEAPRQVQFALKVMF
jgi:hypothetical protein